MSAGLTTSAKKRAIVTGGSGGIGGALCERLAADGYHVIVHANSNRDAANACVARIVAAGGSAEAVAFDVCDGVAARSALDALMAHGPIQVIVNNAGIHDDAVFPAMRAEQWHRVIDVSVNGFFNVTQPLLLPMLRTRWGRIVNLSSGWGAHAEGLAGPGAYGVAKASLNALTRVLPRDLPTCVKVNACCPGWVATRMGGPSAPLTPEQGADTPIWLALLPDDGPTGGFFRRRTRVPW